MARKMWSIHEPQCIKGFKQDDNSDKSWILLRKFLQVQKWMSLTLVFTSYHTENYWAFWVDSTEDTQNPL